MAALYWHVHWQDTWEPKEAMHNLPESPDLFKEYMKRAAAHRAEEETRPDLPLNNKRDKAMVTSHCICRLYASTNSQN